MDKKIIQPKFGHCQPEDPPLDLEMPKKLLKVYGGATLCNLAQILRHSQIQI